MIQRTYLIDKVDDNYVLAVLDENKQQVHRMSVPTHLLVLDTIIRRQKGIDLGKEYILVDRTIGEV